MTDDRVEGSEPSNRAEDFSIFAEIGLLPENAVPMFGMLLVGYLDPEDGIVYDDYWIVGRQTLREALGTLESVKFRIAMNQYGVRRDGEEEP